MALNRRRAAADMDYVVRSHSQIAPGAGPRRPSRLGAGRIATALMVLAASILFVSPMALWAQYGDRTPLRTGAVAIGAMLLSFALIRRLTERPEAAAVPAAMPLPSPSPVPHRPRRSLPRPPRDVGCHEIERRTARRRTRP
jgi:hypothetical protein